jgi:hypothetical protein
MRELPKWHCFFWYTLMMASMPDQPLNMLTPLSKRCRHPTNMTDEGDIMDYLVVNVTKLDDGHIKLSQPQLIDQIIKDVNFKSNTEPQSTPAQSNTALLNKDDAGKSQKALWHFRLVIGKLNYLEKSSWPKVSRSQFCVSKCHSW